MNLEWLKAKALEATPGPWLSDIGNCEVESRNREHWRTTVVRFADISERNDHNRAYNLELNPPENPRHPMCDGDYVAAANPNTVLVLIRIAELAADAARNGDTTLLPSRHEIDLALKEANKGHLG